LGKKVSVDGPVPVFI